MDLSKKIPPKLIVSLATGMVTTILVLFLSFLNFNDVVTTTSTPNCKLDALAGAEKTENGWSVLPGSVTVAQGWITDSKSLEHPQEVEISILDANNKIIFTKLGVTDFPRPDVEAAYKIPSQVNQAGFNIGGIIFPGVNNEYFVQIVGFYGNHRNVCTTQAKVVVNR